MKQIAIICFCFSSCNTPLNDSFNSIELISRKGERIYVNSLNWGVTHDHQMTCISRNPDRVKDRKDTVDVVKGLEPFICLFRNDSLKLFFLNEIFYRVNERFNTISVSYVALPPNEYYAVVRKVGRDSGYYSVPMKKTTTYPSDMPMPPSN